MRAPTALLLVLAAACGGGGASSTTDETTEADTRAHFPRVPERGATMSPFGFATIVTPGDPDEEALFAFGEALPASAWWTGVSQAYGLGPIAHHARWEGARSMSGPSMSDAEIVDYIVDTLAANADDPAARIDDHTLFVVYLPPGTHSMDSATGEVNTNCGMTSGFHTYDAKTHLVWAAIERCPPAYGWSTLQEATQTASHEIAEAATDPWIDPARPGWSLGCATPDEPWKCSPFAVGTQGEIGDLCPETRWDEAGFVFTRVYSNAAAAAGGDPCVPSVAAPYFGVTTSASWYEVAPGATTTIAVSAWSTDALPPWPVGAGIVASSAGKPAIEARLDTNSMASGGGASLRLDVPATAKHGDYVVVEIASEAPPGNPAGDPEHEYYVGAYVP